VSPPAGPPGKPRRWPAGLRGSIGIGTGIGLIAAGAILRFAVSAVSLLGLNLHAVGVILIVVGVFGLLLRPLARVRGHSDRPPPDRPRHPIWPVYRRKHLAEIRRESAADVAELRDDGGSFSPDAPGWQGDDL